ncbi:PREDICTED: uncharacterized protein LOC105314460 [Amphimedon queenslandica]|uniref:Chromo domain-containing protein n=1 Tax=Amphimedon queenslandica TaxID=400682 RepID=A0AAN0JM13_AMPQE|nr:PREDICTED: uncharacterized protein LOC105314460 [Amphimedon queenslandica]|eukprot:XP_019858046.1 PREDICTED: uncharacterized protein LOC105314460 [Amphimedon queenslandica]
MAVRSSRSQRVCSIKQYEKGYYRRLIDTETEDVEKESTLILTSDDVYEVERLIEQRMIKGKVYYLVLWKNYSKEEATWEPESEITEAAVRLYHEPQPPIRAILDAVSSFSLVLQNNLKAGLLRRRSMSLEFPRYVFNFLFNNKGNHTSNRPGCLYQRCDFSAEYFCNGHFEYYNKFGEGCFVSFPIYMYSFVKFSQKKYNSSGECLNSCTFTETLYIKLVKRH